MITIYHNPRCRKSREVLALLSESGYQYEIREYLKQPPDSQELSGVLKKLNIRPLDLIRKGEPVFREKFKGRDFTDEQWIQIMVDNPILIERPVVIRDDQAVIARPPADVKELLKG